MKLSPWRLWGTQVLISTKKHAQIVDPTHPAAITVFPTEGEKQKTLRAGVSWVVP